MKTKEQIISMIDTYFSEIVEEDRDLDDLYAQTEDADSILAEVREFIINNK